MASVVVVLFVLVCATTSGGGGEYSSSLVHDSPTAATASRDEAHQRIHQEEVTKKNKIAKGATAPNQDDENEFRVFIGIKTSEVGVHGKRLPEIHKTWLKEALGEKRIDIRFFTEPHRGGNRSNKNASQAEEYNASMEDMQALLVSTPGCTSILCKTGAMFKYFLEYDTTDAVSGSSMESGKPRQNPPAFFCNFDDDNYVLISNLLRVLKSYHDQGERNIYVGRKGNNDGFRLGEKFNNTLVHFLTGGAGWCISREMLERGRQHFSFLHKLGQIPDDIAVGYVVQEKAGGKLVEDALFHSHLETGLRKRLPKEEVAKQVSFGFNNKLDDRAFAITAFPDIPIELSAQEDPLLFLSLHRYLSLQKSAT
eukprot:CAMPEP_0119023890 /NCGR_PEP_ID=MMETSP1176-20130426/30839_1 /TAXON_ID=265551 /ORGANISM="Synedropsis recta cf, Strain CCMP1620" /LENGTH=366 /DNA_ID=CAMNT_0006979049 /DNA_START=125 /DNA_END=1225 /DNA_ORIENTATION=+